jgi:hypothetical protein
MRIQPLIPGAAKPAQDRINMKEAYEILDWSKKFGVSARQLLDAVKVVGPRIKDVRKKLGK